MNILYKFHKNKVTDNTGICKQYNENYVVIYITLNTCSEKPSRSNIATILIRRSLNIYFPVIYTHHHIIMSNMPCFFKYLFEYIQKFLNHSTIKRCIKILIKYAMRTVIYPRTKSFAFYLVFTIYAHSTVHRGCVRIVPTHRRSRYS